MLSISHVEAQSQRVYSNSTFRSMQGQTYTSTSSTSSCSMCSRRRTSPPRCSWVCVFDSASCRRFTLYIVSDTFSLHSSVFRCCEARQPFDSSCELLEKLQVSCKGNIIHRCSVQLAAAWWGYCCGSHGCSRRPRWSRLCGRRLPLWRCSIRSGGCIASVASA